MEIGQILFFSASMEMNHVNFPEVYVMSKLPNLFPELQKVLPGITLRSVEIADKRIKWDKGITIEPEEIKALENAEIIVIDSMILSKLLYNLPKAKWVQSTWTGVEMIFEEVDRKKPHPSYKLTRYVDKYFEDQMSNYVIAQIINIERGFYEHHDNQKLGQWVRPFFPNSRVISDITVGLLGSGKLGNSVADLLKSAGAHIISFVQHIRPSLNNHEFTNNLNVVFEKCDYICNILPSTMETRGLLDDDVLKRCQKKPVFINIGRGDIIKEENIIKALSEGWISKAVLDVFEHEPLPEFSPLWNTPNVIITPHIGAMPCITGSAKMIAENYYRYVSGKELLNEVDWSKGY